MPLQSPKVRTDLKYQADPAEEGRYFVKDPIRGEFFRYNELQVTMMRALDGKRTIPQVQEMLAEQFGAEVPAVAIDRFVERLERSMLLDINSYRVDDDKTRRAILNSLRKRKLALRVKARDDSSPEAALFEAGTRQIHDGDPCLAASYLEAVLEINPNNERARQVLQCIQEAYFKTKVAIPSHVKMFHVWNPERFLTAADRRFGGFLFSGFGIAVMALFILSSVVSAIDVLSRPQLFSSVGVLDGVVFLLVFAFHVVFHELSHGLACKHYGGVVDDLGLLLMYGILPGGYCDVSESYLFANRWHKIRVQLAGVFGHLVLQAATWHILNLTDSTFPLWTAMLGVNLSVVYSNVKNMIPLAKFDGYYALTEFTNLANLRERSFTYLKDRLAAVILGLPRQVPAVTPRISRIFTIYGILAWAFTAGLLYFLFISFLLPKAVEVLGTVGLVLSVLYIAQQIAFKIGRALVRFATLVIRQRSIIFTRRRSVAFIVALTAIVIMLSLPWPLYVQGEMVVEPRTSAHVRAGEPGLVEEVRVREGQFVQAGQVVAVLRGDELARDRAVAVAELAMARAELELLKRGTRIEELAVASAHTRVDASRYGAALGRLAEQQRLRNAGIVSAAGTLKRAALASEARGELRVSSQAQLVVRAGARVEDVDAQQSTIRRLEAVLAAIDVRVDKLQLRSPIAGVVVTSRPEEQRGRYVATGREVLEVHDVSRWRLRIVPDRGEPLAALEPGQRVELGVRGDPNHWCEGDLDAIAPPETADSSLVVYASGTQPEWRSGMTGFARIYVPSRSIGYRLIALPVIRLFDFELWRVL
ncbi:MAG: efflux RND transporter periplasmic adaptor subunit [Kofleriaceae bacterium]